MKFAVAYVSSLVAFGIADALWIPNFALPLYRDILQNMMVEQVRIVPAAVFYFAYPVGLAVFAVLPGLSSGSLFATAWRAALLGALCYATYDLTNYATLKAWTLQVTLIDIAYGAIASLICASISHVVTKRVA